MYNLEQAIVFICDRINTRSCYEGVDIELNLSCNPNLLVNTFNSGTAGVIRLKNENNGIYRFSWAPAQELLKT